MNKTELTQANSGVVVEPVYHTASGTQIRRVTYRAYLTLRSYMHTANATIHPQATACIHTHGHKTTKAAVECGTRMWHKLDKE